jgi:hypothetical protein
VGLLGLYLVEIINPQAYFGCDYDEPAFDSRHFRPIKETSIELFEKLLVPINPSGAAIKRRRQKVVVPA